MNEMIQFIHVNYFFLSLHQPVTNNQMRNTKLFVLIDVVVKVVVVAIQKKKGQLGIFFTNYNKNKNQAIWYFSFGFQLQADATKQTFYISSKYYSITNSTSINEGQCFRDLKSNLVLKRIGKSNTYLS